jgi:hypothetical protein
MVCQHVDNLASTYQLNRFRIICIHAAGWAVTVDEEDPFGPLQRTIHVIHLPYDREALLQAPSLFEIRRIGGDILNQVQQSMRGPVRFQCCLDFNYCPLRRL